jgi:NAD(P)H-hydrate epimerase
MKIQQSNRQSLPTLNAREQTANKSDFGRVLLVGGSRGMAGSIAMSAGAALHCGSGLVRVATPDCCLETVAGFYPEVMTVPLPNDPVGQIANGTLDRLVKDLQWANVVAIGPGMGVTDTLKCVTTSLFESFGQPLVIDADALNALAHAGFDSVACPTAPRILTPHPGEMERLTGIDSRDRKSQIRAAIRLGDRLNCILVLKGHATFVTDGQQHWENTSGTPAMATGGSGDVLTGMIASLLGQRDALGISILDAVRTAIFVHGFAAERLAEHRSRMSVLPTQIISEVQHLLGEMVRASTSL